MQQAAKSGPLAKATAMPEMRLEKKKEGGDIFEKEEISHKNEDSNAALD